MTAVHPTTLTDQPLRETRAATVVRRVVQADAAVTAVGGIVVLAAAEPVADLLGLATTGPVLAVGAVFVALSLVLALLGRADARSMLRLVPINAAGDLVWAAASIGVAALAELSGTGRALIAVQAVVVLAVGEAKLITVRRARSLL
ncbi:MAG: hypothetical protein ABIP36_07280 [Acidimicrobiales bacterium]